MFLGRFEHTIDEKGRLTIPARYREFLADGAFITQGLDRNLIVLPSASFENMSNNVNALSMTDPAARQLRRLIFSSAVQCDIDRAGRVLIPQFLRESIGLQDNVVIVGVGEHFEIWSPSHWAMQNDLLQDTDANAQRFADLDLPIR
jgi:MraZ protein